MGTLSNDWRIRDQEEYLVGKILHREEFRKKSESWDHEHCEFCFEKFSEDMIDEEVQLSGYTDSEKRYWICTNCFNDFKDHFKWVEYQ